MTNYWCVNFDFDECLNHGLQKNLWMMQYQYALDADNVFQGDRKASVTANWRRCKKIQIGDWLVAYLPMKRTSTGNSYFAIGQVCKPRKPAKPASNISSVEEYIASKRSHDVTSGVVRYSDAIAFYEDFDDDWSDVNFPEMKYAQRIDVKRWQYIVPNGVPWLSKLNIGPNEIQRAFFRIQKKHFNEIKNDLQLAKKVQQKKSKKYAASTREQGAASEASERAYAKGQGYQLDSQLRKAIEDYSMKAAAEHFESLGYKVEDVSQNNPYDLKCSKASKTIYVEVKGTQSSGESVILTAGEVGFASKHESNMVLFLLHSITVAADKASVSGGKMHVLMPWLVNDADLAPLSFKYRVP